jgi:hypothetical protein
MSLFYFLFAIIHSPQILFEGKKSMTFPLTKDDFELLKSRSQQLFDSSYQLHLNQIAPHPSLSKSVHETIEFFLHDNIRESFSSQFKGVRLWDSNSVQSCLTTVLNPHCRSCLLVKLLCCSMRYQFVDEDTSTLLFNHFY